MPHDRNNKQSEIQSDYIVDCSNPCIFSHSWRQSIQDSVITDRLPQPGTERVAGQVYGTLYDDAEVGRHLPVLVRHALATSWAGKSGLQIMSLEAAVLFVDVSGYTSLTQRAVRAGADVLERFKVALNEFFCRVINTVYDDGGDVVTFEGDAILALFPAGEAPLLGAVERAARCALQASQLQLDVSALGLEIDVKAAPLISTWHVARSG
jgi:class 3 adenylate cyclase